MSCLSLRHQHPAILLLLLLCACGGGGGGGGGGASPPAEVSVVYDGSTAQAEINSGTHVFFMNEILSGAAGPSSVAASIPAVRQERLKRTVLKQIGRGKKSAQQNVNTSENCVSGGSIQLVGYVSESGSGDYTVTFNNCRESINGFTVETNGKVHFDATSSLYYTLNYLGLDERMSEDASSILLYHIQLGGSVTYNDESHRSESNLIQIDLLSGLQIKHENYTVVTVGYFGGYYAGSYIGHISGRIYHSEYGYVDVSTGEDFSGVDDSYEYDQIFPEYGGPIKIAGVNGSAVYLARTIDGVSSSLFTIASDFNGDGVIDGYSRRDQIGAPASDVYTSPQAVLAHDKVRWLENGSSSLSLASSTDPDGDFIRYHWSLESAPPGAVTVLSAPDKPVTDFNADKPGEYLLKGQVSDNASFAVGEARLVSYTDETTAWLNATYRPLILARDSAHGRYFATTEGGSFTISEITMATGAVRDIPGQTWGSDPYLLSVAVSPDGNSLAVFSYGMNTSSDIVNFDITLHIVDRVSGDVRKTLSLGPARYEVLDSMRKSIAVWPKTDWIYYIHRNTSYVDNELRAQSALYAVNVNTGARVKAARGGLPSTFHGEAKVVAHPSGDRLYLIADGSISPDGLGVYDIAAGEALGLWTLSMVMGTDASIGFSPSGTPYLLHTFGNGVYEIGNAGLNLSSELTDPVGGWHPALFDHSQQRWWNFSGSVLQSVTLDGGRVVTYPLLKKDFSDLDIQNVFMDATTGMHHIIYQKGGLKKVIAF